MLEKYLAPMKVAIFRHTNISKGSDGLTDPTSMFNFFKNCQPDYPDGSEHLFNQRIFQPLVLVLLIKKVFLT